ncbi:MAG: cytochrome P460 family protein [Chlorobiales bacterium]|nr:cytochrome P460 family protein [Chlorobiales bacterium]
MRLKLFFMVLVAGICVLTGCPAQENTTKEETETAAKETPDFEQMAIDLWNEEFSHFGYWELIPGTAKHQESKGNPHGHYGSIYGNDITMDAINQQFEVMPDGAILLRENFNEEMEQLKITVMRKTEEKWFWAVYDFDGSVQTAGDLRKCQECHRQAEYDSLFVLSNME